MGHLYFLWLLVNQDSFHPIVTDQFSYPGLQGSPVNWQDHIDHVVFQRKYPMTVPEILYYLGLL